LTDEHAATTFLRKQVDFLATALVNRKEFYRNAKQTALFYENEPLNRKPEIS
jgi:hypothetical protein